ncbi:lantibiotic dehydratase [Streptomyces sp. NPDC058961]|uniref:lantibiotic dehydratase n=1 Tax=Streptomyces sp. NPDC058961 TaxID=3346680 RepID=UPI0036B9072A
MAEAAQRLLYEHTGVLLVRATTYPGTPIPGVDAVLPITGGEPERQWLATAWAHDELRRAVEGASPVLARQITAAVDHTSTDRRELRRLSRSLASYVLRWQGRAVPFGMFAGVAAARTGSPFVRWGTGHRVRLAADTVWLDGIVRRLENVPALYERITVVANNTVSVRGGRLVVPGPAPRDPRELAPLELTIAATGPVLAAVDAARLPIPVTDLFKALSSEYPAASHDQLTTLLDGLLAHQVLLTSLRAPVSEPDALGDLCAQLEAADAASLPDVADIAPQLDAIHGEMNRLRLAAAHAERAVLARRMGTLNPDAPQPLVADLGLDAEITVPTSVVEEAEAAASALLRLTPYPHGYPRWKDFHSRFRQRYGAGAVVPVTDLVADSGLGWPAGYLGSAWTTSPRTLTPRDETLLTLVYNALLDGRDEIALTRHTMRSLAVGDPDEITPPPLVELAFQLHAENADAVQRGRFDLWVTSAPRPGSSMAGRFATLLPEPDRARLANSYTTPGTLNVQLSFPARRRRSENVIRTPRLLPDTLTLAGHPTPSGALDLDDLAVTADARHFHLVQLSTGRRVETRIPHALEAGTLTPPLARLLAEITTARCAVYRGFDWGAASRLPYLPRLRHGRTVLAPARWLLASSELPAASRPMAEWETAFTAWRTRLHIPADVLLVEADLRLPIDCDVPLHRSILRARLDQAHEVQLHETPAPARCSTSPSAGWGFMGRAHEFLIRLRATTSATAQLPPQTPPVAPEDAHLPGCSRLLHAHLAAHPARHDEILTDHLPRLLDLIGAPVWWFDRYRDTSHPDRDQYLTLTVRLPDGLTYGQGAECVGTWAERLRGAHLTSGLSLATFEPQTGRFGHGAAMEAAEAVFAADASAAIAQLECVRLAGVSAQALTAASLADIAVSFAETARAGRAWLAEHLPQGQGRLSPTDREETFQLTGRHSRDVLRSLPGGGRVADAWEQRRIALAAYRQAVDAQRDPDTVMRSLLHHHHVRAVGVDPDRESITHRLARVSARRVTR